MNEALPLFKRDGMEPLAMMGNLYHKKKIGLTCTNIKERNTD